MNSLIFTTPSIAEKRQHRKKIKAEMIAKFSPFFQELINEQEISNKCKT